MPSPKTYKHYILNFGKVLFLCIQKKSFPSSHWDPEVALHDPRHHALLSMHTQHRVEFLWAFTFSAFSFDQNHEIRKSIQKRKIYPTAILPTSKDLTLEEESLSENECMIR